MERTREFLASNFPMLCAVLVGVIGVLFSKQIAYNFSNENWSLSSLYTALFGWFSVQFGFLFSTYSLVLGRPSKMMQAVRKTDAFRLAKLYIKRSALMSLTISALILPALVTSPSVRHLDHWSSGYAVLLIYSIAAAYLFARLIRCVRILAILEGVD